MYEYTITRINKIINCMDCPMRKTESITEGISTQGTMSLSATTAIIRNVSICGLTNEHINYPVIVDSYNSNCPLKDKCKTITNIKEETK